MTTPVLIATPLLATALVALAFWAAENRAERRDRDARARAKKAAQDVEDTAIADAILSQFKPHRDHLGRFAKRQFHAPKI